MIRTRIQTNGNMILHLNIFITWNTSTSFENFFGVIFFYLNFVKNIMHTLQTLDDTSSNLFCEIFCITFLSKFCKLDHKFEP